MTVTSDDVLARLNAGDDDGDEAARILTIASTIVTKFVDDSELETEVPDEILDEALLRCAVNLFNRAKAPNGYLMQIGDPGLTGATPLRVALDPLVDVRPLLAPYGVVDLGFA